MLSGERTLFAVIAVVALLALILGAGCPNDGDGQQYSLGITIDPPGGGTVVKSPDLLSYDAGTAVLLTAIPATGYKFLHWSGAATGTALTATVIMDDYKSVTATFFEVPALASAASPAGGGFTSDDLPMTITLSANKTDAMLYYTITADGSAPREPTETDNDGAGKTPLSVLLDVDTYKDSKARLNFRAIWDNPDTGNKEIETPYHSVTYSFLGDTEPPTVTAEPPGDTFQEDALPLEIVLKAEDNEDAPADITIYYTTDSSEPTTSSDSGTGDGTTIEWTESDLTLKFFAADTSANESAVVTEEYYLDTSTAGAKKVLELINVERAAQTPPLDALEWKQDWADACREHAEQLELAGGTNTKPSDPGADGKQLLDYDQDGENYRLSAGMSTSAWGMHSPTAQSFFDVIIGIQSIKAILLNPDATHFGCGVDDNTWIALISQ